MNTGKITQPFRNLGWMHGLDKLKFIWQKCKNHRRNARFVKAHPALRLPPNYMLFEAFQLDFQKYYEGGQRTATWIKGLFEQYRPMNGHAILDWGCGPARVVRHFPNLLDPASRVYGTDYNAGTIEWCRANIEGVQFSINQLHPPTGFEDGQFDFVYGISIFTHLSEDNHPLWFDELMRITQKAGLVLLTTHGQIFREKLTDAECRDFDAGKLVARGNVVEGHRVFAAFQPPAYLQQLFGSKADVLQHIPGGRKSWGLEQDVWILRKR